MVNNETQPDLQSHPLFGCNLLSSGPWLVDLRPRYLRALSSSTPRGGGSIRAGQGSVIAFSRCCFWPINLSFFPLKNQGKSINFGCHLSHQVPSHSQATSASCVRSCIHTRSRRNIAKTRRGTKRSSGLFRSKALPKQLETLWKRSKGPNGDGLWMLWVFALEPGIVSSKSEVSSLTSAATIRDADPLCHKWLGF